MAGIMAEPLVYLNGAKLPASAAHVAIYDAAIVMGVAVSEVVRTFRHRLFRLSDHLTRFLDSCCAVGLEPPLALPEMVRVCDEIAAHNATLVSPGMDLALVLFLSPGALPSYAGWGAGAPATPTFCVHTFPLALSRWKHAFTEGLQLITPSVRHVPPQCINPQIKHRSRLHWWLASREVEAAAPHAIPLCLDLDGNITETPTANFAMVKNGAVITPPLRRVLPGISLRVVRELCTQAGIDFFERDLKVEDVLQADEAFLTSTSCCMAPVAKINGKSIGGSLPGAVFQRLIADWSRLVGTDIVAQIMQG